LFSKETYIVLGLCCYIVSKVEQTTNKNTQHVVLQGMVTDKKKKKKITRHGIMTDLYGRFI